MSWTTTFHYQQELRSSYMNNIFTGVLRPGVYNANVVLYADAAPDNATNRGVWVRIGEGTTLVFSNGYDVVNGIVRRNLSKIGSYVVKCVATTDMTFQLTRPGVLHERFLQAGLGNETLAPLKFVTAEFAYDPDNIADIVPDFRFRVSEKNPNFIEDVAYRLPNEGYSVANTNLARSYLLLGVAIDNNRSGQQNYATGLEWTTDGLFVGPAAWIENHVFTGRGLPDYRGGMSKNFTAPPPDFMFSPGYNRVYLSPGQYYYNSILYAMPGIDWKVIYQITTADTPAPPTPTSGWIVDHTTAGPEATSYIKADPPAPDSGNLLLDFYFIALRSEYSQINPEDLSGLLAGSDFLVEQRILHKQVTADSLNLGDDWAFRTAQDRIFGLPTPVVPLDVSMRNIERLKSLFLNRNVLLPVINNMRSDPTFAPYLNPQMGQSLLPIAVAIRYQAVDENDRDIQSLNDIPTLFDIGAVAGSDVNPVGAVNPANVLSFLDMQSTSFAVFGAALAAQEVFETLPFLD